MLGLEVLNVVVAISTAVSLLETLDVVCVMSAAMDEAPDVVSAMSVEVFLKYTK